MSDILIITSTETGGDLSIAMAVSMELSRRGHNLRFAGDAGVAEIARSHNFAAESSSSVESLGLRMMRAHRLTKQADMSSRGNIFRETMLDWAREIAAWVVESTPNRKVELIVTTLGVAPIGQFVQARSGIPFAVVSGTFYIGPGAPRVLADDIAPSMVPTFEAIRASLEDACLVVHGTWPEFEYGFVDLPPAHRYAGPLFWEPPGQAPDYLAVPGHPWILATLSSMTLGDIPLGRAILDALAPLPVRVLLTTGTAHDSGTFSSVPPNARVEPYIPHSAVLERSALFVSYGGTGAVMKALWFGVPMVLVPWGGVDRPGVAARAQNLGAAVVLERDELTPEALAAAVEHVLADTRYRAAAQATSDRLRQHRGVGVACDAIERRLDSDR